MRFIRPAAADIVSVDIERISEKILPFFMRDAVMLCFVVFLFFKIKKTWVSTEKIQTASGFRYN